MSTSAAPADTLSNAFRQYYDLTKPRVVMLIVFTAIVGMLLAVPGIPDIGTVLAASLGIGLAASSGAAMNQIIDMRADAIMARTQNRPLATGGLGVTQAVVFAFILCALGMVLLVYKVNTLTAVLTFISMVGYGVIYTVFLKPATPQNIVIGGAAGAAPPLLGWVAMTNSVTAEACLLFLIIFAWTPPHFWALALYRREEYAAAGVPMLPVTHGEEFTRLQILLYTYILIAVTLLPFTIHMFGGIYLAAAVYLNARFMYYVYRLYRNYSDALSRTTFFYSIKYLMYLFAVMLLDHYLWDRLVLALM
ncbi:MAG: protoheme IX farnesyltransferase [Gammaproteobacteria bacterium]|nr:protoheme IX farnesyltransferase [Gammaproteobacteria bacterium]